MYEKLINNLGYSIKNGDTCYFSPINVTSFLIFKN